MLGAVGVHRHDHAFARHERGVLGNRVDRLDLVAPPVGEGRGACAVRSDFLCDLVALEHVLERRHLEAEFIRNPDQHEDFVGAV